jgi:hypothetical protein
VSTKADRHKTVLAEGRAVRDWAWGWNLYDDGSSDHHGRASLWYGANKLFEGRAYVEIIAHVTRRAVPQTFCYEGNNFDRIVDWVKSLCLSEGGVIHPHGVEYDSYYGEAVLPLCYAATLKKDSVAAALERQAAKLLARHTRAVPKYD